MYRFSDKNFGVYSNLKKFFLKLSLIFVLEYSSVLAQGTSIDGGWFTYPFVLPEMENLEFLDNPASLTLSIDGCGLELSDEISVPTVLNELTCDSSPESPLASELEQHSDLSDVGVCNIDPIEGGITDPDLPYTHSFDFTVSIIRDNSEEENTSWTEEKIRRELTAVQEALETCGIKFGEITIVDFKYSHGNDIAVVDPTLSTVNTTFGINQFKYNVEAEQEKPNSVHTIGEILGDKINRPAVFYTESLSLGRETYSPTEEQKRASSKGFSYSRNTGVILAQSNDPDVNNDPTLNTIWIGNTLAFEPDGGNQVCPSCDCEPDYSRTLHELGHTLPNKSFHHGIVNFIMYDEECGRKNQFLTSDALSSNGESFIYAKDYELYRPNPERNGVINFMQYEQGVRDDGYTNGFEDYCSMLISRGESMGLLERIND